MQFCGDAALLGKIAGIEPGAAQFLDVRAVRPAVVSGLAVGPQIRITEALHPFPQRYTMTHLTHAPSRNDASGTLTPFDARLFSGGQRVLRLAFGAWLPASTFSTHRGRDCWSRADGPWL
jgi:hypothetical protein